MKRFPRDRGLPRSGMSGLSRFTGDRPPRGPEHNLIQRPDLTKSLVDRLGLRQAHITPTLDEHVQPVIIVDDIHELSATSSYIASGVSSGDGVNLAPAVHLASYNNVFRVDEVWIAAGMSTDPAGSGGNFIEGSTYTIPTAGIFAGLGSTPTMIQALDQRSIRTVGAMAVGAFPVSPGANAVICGWASEWSTGMQKLPLDGLIIPKGGLFGVMGNTPTYTATTYGLRVSIRFSVLE